MAKLLDKKERVYDLKLTNYGHYLMSVGKFKPTYYSFFDDNIIYDSSYSNISESQNQAHTRIKQETPYIESLVLFENIDGTLDTIPVSTPPLNVSIELATDSTLVESLGLGAPVVSSDGAGLSPPTIAGVSVVDTGIGSEIGASAIIETEPSPPSYFAVDVTPTIIKPRQDIFKFDAAIGDAFLDGKQTNLAPAWKVVVLSGEISSSAQKYHTNNSSSLNIPQINVVSNYKKEIKDLNYSLPADGESINETNIFADNKYIQLTSDPPIIYIDEVNTELLTNNFDVEVFKVDTETGTSAAVNDLQRKFFETKINQVVDGLMVSANKIENDEADITINAVEYYFDFIKDKNVDKQIVCKQLQIFNKSSYYIDLDFDCESEETENIYNDIYGSEVVPEICLD